MSLQYGRRDGYTVNDLTGNDLDSRSAFSGKGQLLWTPIAKLGDARHRQRRARSRRRLRAERSRWPSREPVSHGARLRGLHPSRHLRDDDPEPLRGLERHGVVHDRVRGLEDRRCHRSRLHAAAARHARQHGRELPVHPGSACRHRGQRPHCISRIQSLSSGRAACSSSRRTTSRTRREISRPVPVSVPAVPGDADVAAGRARRRGHRRLRTGCRHRWPNVGSDGWRAVRSRAEGCDAERVLHAGHCAAAADGGRRGLLERVAAVCRGLSSPARQDRLRVRRADTRPAGSIRRRLRGRRPTAKSTHGTSKAA